jgi:hypothetical protein
MFGDPSCTPIEEFVEQYDDVTAAGPFLGIGCVEVAKEGEAKNPGASSASPLKRAFDEVAILLPECITGGPEAIHQLSQAINSLGGAACLAYTGGKSTATLVNDGQQIKLICSLDPDSLPLKIYEKYAPRTISEMPLGGNNLFIFPEIHAATARGLSGFRRAIWWLSVDNASLVDPRLDYQNYRDYIFGDPTLMHFYQSDYARDFLVKNRARQVYPLFDYTDELFLEPLGSPAAPRKRQIAFFPRKGVELAAELRATAPNLPFVPIENMTKAQVRETLRTSALYIDFGHHPGKDRIPREAAASGAIVLLHDKGAGSLFADHPLDRDYLFTLADIRDGSLLARVNEILDNYDAHFARQRYYRHRIRLEKEEFLQQVKTFFFDSN